MKFTKHFHRLVIAAFLSILALPSCTSFQSDSSGSLSAAPAYTASSKRGSSTPRHLKRSGRLSMKSRNLDKAAARSVSLVKSYEAQIASSTLTEANYSAHIRVPVASLKPLLDSLTEVGSVDYQKISMDDVTESYLNLQATLKNKRALRDRLRKLLGRATKIEDILKIETELARVQTELDQMEVQMKRLSTQVDLSSLHLSIKRQSIPGPLGLLTKGTGWALTKLFTLN